MSPRTASLFRMPFTTIAAIAAIAGFASCTPTLHAQAVVAQADFASNAQGWTCVTALTEAALPAAAPVLSTWRATGGNLDGFLEQTDPDGAFSYWSAPPAFLGDKSAVYGGVLSYDLKQSATTPVSGEIADVVLVGAGTVLVLDQPYNPETAWSRYHALLASGGGWRVNSAIGPLATASQVQAVLASLTGVFIRAEYRSGVDTNGIDNARMTTYAASLPASTFDTSTERWWVVGDSARALYGQSSGNPGGFLRAIDLGGRLWLFLAPERFLGNRSAAVGGAIEFDQRVDFNEGTDVVSTVVITGGGVRLTYSDSLASTVWQRKRVDLVPGPAWSRVPAGTVTLEDFSTVLSSLSELRIRGEYSSQLDTGDIDNVVFFAGNLCDSIDFNGDGLFPDDQDLLDFLSVLAGGACSTGTCNDIDFNNDGLFPDDNDLVAFLTVLAGGAC